MADSGRSWPLEKYTKYDNANKLWMDIPIEKGNCWFLLKENQVLIVNNKTAVESVCLVNSDANAGYARNCLGITFQHNKVSPSKFKVTFGATDGRTNNDNCLEVVKELGKFIPVIEHPAHKGLNPNKNVGVTKALGQVTKELLQTNLDIFKGTDFVIPKENIAEMIQQCLLDPNFPALVATVNNILNEKIEKEDC